MRKAVATVRLCSPRSRSSGWGIFVALFAVFGAPRLQASFGIAKTMYANLAAFAVVVLVIAICGTRPG